MVLTASVPYDTIPSLGTVIHCIKPRTLIYFLYISKYLQDQYWEKAIIFMCNDQYSSILSYFVDSVHLASTCPTNLFPCLPTNWTWLNLTSVHCVSLVFIGVGGNCNFIISYKLCPGHWWITVSWINVCTPCWAWRFIMSYKQSTLAVWDEITYPFPNFNDAAVKVWE